MGLFCHKIEQTEHRSSCCACLYITTCHKHVISNRKCRIKSGEKDWTDDNRREPFVRSWSVGARLCVASERIHEGAGWGRMWYWKRMDWETVSPGQCRCEAVKQWGNWRRSVLDISGHCPGVIHTPLLQSAAKHNNLRLWGQRGTRRRWRMSEMWGTGSIPWGKANYRLTAPCLWHAAQIRWKLLRTNIYIFPSVAIRNDTIQMLHIWLHFMYSGDWRAAVRLHIRGEWHRFYR